MHGVCWPSCSGITLEHILPSVASVYDSGSTIKRKLLHLDWFCRSSTLFWSSLWVIESLVMAAEIAAVSFSTDDILSSVWVMHSVWDCISLGSSYSPLGTAWSMVSVIMGVRRTTTACAISAGEAGFMGTVALCAGVGCWHSSGDR